MKALRTIILSLVLISGLQANEQKSNLNQANNVQKSNSLDSKIVSGLKSTAKYTGKAVNFIYRNSGHLLSKNTLATAMIIGAPYIYLSDTDILAHIATGMSDMTFKISDAAMSGMLRAAYNNKAIVARLSSIFAAKFLAAEAAKVGISEGMKYSTAALGALIRGYFGWNTFSGIINN